MNNISLVELIKVRAAVYRLFSQAFSQPDDRLLSMESLAYLEESLVGTGLQAHDLLKRLKATDNQHFATSVKIDYVKLFQGLGKHPTSPYECLHRGEKFVMGDATMDVVAFYKAAGLELDARYADLPDHLSAELSFLAHLCDVHANCLEHTCEGSIHSLELQRRFYKEHLGIWIESFCAKTIEYAETDYYRELAGLLREWCTLDQAIIEELQTKHETTNIDSVHN